MKRIALVLSAVIVCLFASAGSRAEDNPLLGKWQRNVEVEIHSGVCSERSNADRGSGWRRREVQLRSCECRRQGGLIRIQGKVRRKILSRHRFRDALR
jgi:hypothetical protein